MFLLLTVSVWMNRLTWVGLNWFSLFSRLSGHTYRQAFDKWESTRPRIINDYFRKVKKRVWKKELSWQKFFLDFNFFMSQLWAMISRELRTISIAVLIGMQWILFICKDWVLIAIYLIVFIQRERHKLNSSWQFKIVSVNSKIALHWWQWSYVKKKTFWLKF